MPQSLQEYFETQQNQVFQWLSFPLGTEGLYDPDRFVFMIESMDGRIDLMGTQFVDMGGWMGCVYLRVWNIEQMRMLASLYILILLRGRCVCVESACTYNCLSV